MDDDDDPFQSDEARVLKRRIHTEQQLRKAAESRSKRAMKELLDARRENVSLKAEIQGRQQKETQSQGGHIAEVDRLRRRMAAQDKLIGELQLEMNRRKEAEQVEVAQIREEAERVERTLQDQLVKVKETCSQAEVRAMDERQKRHTAEQGKRDATAKAKENKEKQTIAVGAQRRAEERLMTVQAQVDRTVESRQAMEKLERRLKDQRREHQRELSRVLVVMDQQKNQLDEATQAAEAAKEAAKAAHRRAGELEKKHRAGGFEEGNATAAEIVQLRKEVQEAQSR